MLSVSAFDPLSRSMGPMLKEESYHLGTGINGLLRIVKAGKMPAEVIQRFFYKWIPTAFDLFGTDNSSSAHWAYVWGLKGRYDERESGGNGEPDKSKLNELARNLYRQEIVKLVERLKVFVEIKVLDPRWDDRLLETLDRGPNPKGYAIHSFAFHVVRRFAEKRPDLPRGVLSDVETRNPRRTLEDARAQTLWQERKMLDLKLVRTVHDLGAQIIAWTLHSPSDIERFVRMGVDGICTNHPERGRRIVDAPRAA